MPFPRSNEMQDGWSALPQLTHPARSPPVDKHPRSGTFCQGIPGRCNSGAGRGGLDPPADGLPSVERAFTDPASAPVLPLYARQRSPAPLRTGPRSPHFQTGKIGNGPALGTAREEIALGATADIRPRRRELCPARQTLCALSRDTTSRPAQSVCEKPARDCMIPW